MIESIRGVDALPEILAENVFDMIFVGPLDLAESLGCGSDMANAAVQDAIDSVERQVRTSGAYLGSALRPNELPAHAYARGHAFVTLGCDVGFLRKGAMLLAHQNV